MLLISSGSYTFSGSFRPGIKLETRKPLFQKSYSNGLFGIKPVGALVLKTKPDAVGGFKLKPSGSILKNGVFRLEDMARFLHENNKTISYKRSMGIASIYIEEANKEGINYDVAFSQMCLETGFLNYGGDVDPGQNNFCGLGVTGGGVKGLSFEDERKGIRAHIQHLKAYASTDKLNTELVDERFRFVKRGSAKKVDELTGKWASDKNYGKKINNILRRIDKFSKSE
ncbi:MAG: glucosaminidase domain-containing protein [Chlorobi bacterium]|nr:glucosaminidase domain-containing protein [Chlorobiota bacterium]